MNNELELLYARLAPSPLEEVYEKLVVASGTSEGAKKGWEQRGAGLKKHIESFIPEDQKLKLKEAGDNTFWINHNLGGEVSYAQTKSVHDSIRAHLESQGYKKTGSSHGRQNVSQAGRGVDVYSNEKQEVHLGGSGFSNNDWNAYIHVRNKQ